MHPEHQSAMRFTVTAWPNKKTPSPPTDLEPTPSDTIRVFRRELSFVRTMGASTPGTYALLGLIGLVYILVVFFRDLVAQHLQIPEIQYAHVILLGCKNNAAIDGGEYWRIGSSMLLHGGMLHLLINGYALYVLGKVLEKLYGTRRFLVLFFVSGFCGGLGSYLFTPDNSVGASGAIFGVLGAAVVFGFRFEDHLPARVRRALTFGLVPWVAINVFIGFAHPRIDNAAHMGGLVGGSILALFLGTQLSRQKSSAATIIQWFILGTSLCYMAYCLVAAIAHGYDCSLTLSRLDACLEPMGTAR